MTTQRVGILAVLLSLVLVAGCGGRAEEQQVDERIVPVSVAEVGMVRVTPTLEFSGTIEPSREASVGAMMSAQVRRIHVEPGDTVREGDLMVEMAAEQLTAAEAQFVTVQKDRERMERLLESGAVTRQAFDQMDAAYEAAKASHDIVLESTMIRAPFDGVVAATYLEEGEVFLLMPGSVSTPAIVELIQTDNVKVTISVAERDLAEIKKGLTASLAVATYPGLVFEGTVSLVDPAVSTETRTARAEIAIPNTEGLLRSGMFAHVTLTLASRDVLLVPHDGVLQQEGTGRYYSMLFEDGRSRRVDVVLGHVVGEYHEVLDGLEEGQVVITTGRYRLPDGARVAVSQREAD